MSEKKLKGREALITGASKGLGKAMALALAGSGAKLALASRNLDQLNEVAGEIRAAGGEAKVFKADVSREEDVAKLEKEVAAAYGGVQILINNAGINVRKTITEFTLDEWNSVIDTNLTSVFLMCRSFVPHMKGAAYGRILNMTSIMSWVSLPGRAAYSSSKTALLGLTRALAARAGSGCGHGERHQSRPVRHRDEHAADAEPGDQCAVHVENPAGPLGQGRGDRAARAVFVFRMMRGLLPERIFSSTAGGALSRERS